MKQRVFGTRERDCCDARRTCCGECTHCKQRLVSLALMRHLSGDVLATRLLGLPWCDTLVVPCLFTCQVPLHTLPTYAKLVPHQKALAGDTQRCCSASPPCNRHDAAWCPSPAGPGPLEPPSQLPVTTLPVRLACFLSRKSGERQRVPSGRLWWGCLQGLMPLLALSAAAWAERPARAAFWTAITVQTARMRTRVLPMRFAPGLLLAVS